MVGRIRVYNNPGIYTGAAFFSAVSILGNTLMGSSLSVFGPWVKLGGELSASRPELASEWARGLATYEPGELLVSAQPHVCGSPDTCVGGGKERCRGFGSSLLVFSAMRMDLSTSLLDLAGGCPFLHPLAPEALAVLRQPGTLLVRCSFGRCAA